MDLNLRVILQSPPAGVYFGLQKGPGSKYETVQTQWSGSGNLHFQFCIEIKGDNKKDNVPDFKGPFVQGPAMARFIYIGIGAYAGKEGTWNRRLKIPLTGITWEMVAEMAGKSKSILETHVPGTGKDGGPNCATVKPFAGWIVT